MSALTRLGVSGYRAPTPTGASFVVGTNRTLVGTSDTFAFNTTGAVASDYMLVFMTDDSSAFGQTVTLVGSGTVLTAISNDSNGVSWFHIYWTSLTSSDLSNGTITVAGSTIDTKGVEIVIIRGATTATVKSFAFNSGSTLAFSGFAPSGSSKGVAIATIDVNAATGGPLSADNGTWAVPVQSQPGGYYFSASLLTQFSGYTNATTTVSGFSTNNDQSGWIVELT